MYRTCSKCGKVHKYGEKCSVGRSYIATRERGLRSTYKWLKKSLEIRTKANYLCEVCKDKGIINYKSLEVHHINSIKEYEEGLLDDYNLICLCTKHHKEADEGLIKKDYLFNLAKIREDNK